jgi:GMP synthase (glutamine-hydrolysing)
MKRLHYLQHVPFEDIGTIQAWAEASGMHIGGTRLFNDEQLPSVRELDWLVIMGGPMNVYEESVFPWLRAEKRLIRQAVEQRKIVLGICLGAQLIADALGARVRSNGQKEIGWYPVFKTDSETGQAAVLSAIPDGLEVLHWHGDTFDLPEGAVRLGRSAACKNQGFVLVERVVGLQFHLEITRPNLERLIHHCQSDLDGGPFVQRPEVMLADEGRFAAANTVLNHLLGRLAEVGC